jgi:hypothetical protein
VYGVVFKNQKNRLYSELNRDERRKFEDEMMQRVQVAVGTQRGRKTGKENQPTTKEEEQQEKGGS